MQKEHFTGADVQKNSLWQNLLSGFAAIGQGIYDIANSFTPRKRWRYEDHFGTDAEMIRRDWNIVGDDLRRVIERAQENKDEAPE